MINVTAISENNTVVQCDFITGSDAQGCMVVVVGESENFTTTLQKNNSKNFTLAVTVSVPQQLLCTAMLRFLDMTLNLMDQSA